MENYSYILTWSLPQWGHVRTLETQLRSWQLQTGGQRWREGAWGNWR